MGPQLMNKKQRAVQLAEFFEELLDQQDRIEAKLDAVLSALDDRGAPISVPERTPPSSRRSTPPAALNGKAKESKDKERNVSETTYLRIACKVVRELLKPDAPAVGKMVHILYKELKEGDTTFVLTVKKMSERESFIVLSDAARGQPRFVRIKDRLRAQEWLETAQAEYVRLMGLEGFEKEEG